jgi:hypothetical protein
MHVLRLRHQDPQEEVLHAPQVSHTHVGHLCDRRHHIALLCRCVPPSLAARLTQSSCQHSKARLITIIISNIVIIMIIVIIISIIIIIVIITTLTAAALLRVEPFKHEQPEPKAIDSYEKSLAVDFYNAKRVVHKILLLVEKVLRHTAGRRWS